MFRNRGHGFRLQRIETKRKAIHARSIYLQRRNVAFHGGILFFCPLDDEERNPFPVRIRQKRLDCGRFAAACAAGHQHVPQHILLRKSYRFSRFKCSPNLQRETAFMERLNCREKLLITLPFQPETGITAAGRCTGLCCILQGVQADEVQSLILFHRSGDGQGPDRGWQRKPAHRLKGGLRIFRLHCTGQQRQKPPVLFL